MNGKVRDTQIVNRQSSTEKEQVIAKVKESEKVKKYLEGKTIKKEIFVPGKLVNFVV